MVHAFDVIFGLDLQLNREYKPLAQKVSDRKVNDRKKNLFFGSMGRVVEQVNSDLKSSP